MYLRLVSKSKLDSNAKRNSTKCTNIILTVFKSKKVKIDTISLHNKNKNRRFGRILETNKRLKLAPRKSLFKKITNRNTLVRNKSRYGVLRGNEIKQPNI